MTIELHSVTYGYTETLPIFKDFQWWVEDGETWAVIGPSGCGKSTLLYLLAGIRQPNAGEVVVKGETITRPRPRTGLILQDYGLLPWETVHQNVTLGLRVREFYGPDGTHAPSDEEVREINARADHWIARLGLENVAGQYPGQISGGQRQRTAIARTLALNPDVLLMDEPFASLDAPTRESLQKLVLQLRAEHQMTAIIVTHSIEEAAFLGKKILLLGKPPNWQAQVIANPRAGGDDYLNSPAYVDVCNHLRLTLEAVV